MTAAPTQVVRERIGLMADSHGDETLLRRALHVLAVCMLWLTPTRTPCAATTTIAFCTAALND
jgi:hypothetical protein